MAATATAPRTRRPAPKPRRATAAKRPARRRGITPPAGLAIPAAAVGRTAVAVGGIADSGVVVRLTRSRLWIGLLAVLLVGIVALNVYALSLNASGSRVAQESEKLALENSALRIELTEQLSNSRITDAGSKLGLAAPAPDTIRYLRGSDTDAAAAAMRLLDGDLSAAATAEPSAPAQPVPADVAPVALESAPAVPDPAATTDPAAVAPAPAAVAPTPVTP